MPTTRRQNRAGATNPNSIAAASTALRIASYSVNDSPSTSSRRARLSLRDAASTRSSAARASAGLTRWRYDPSASVYFAGSSRCFALIRPSASRALRYASDANSPVPSCPCADSRHSAALRFRLSASISRTAEPCPASLRTSSCSRNDCASFTKISFVRAAPTSTTASITATSPRYDATSRTPSSGYPSPRSSTGLACSAADPHILRVASSSSAVAVTTPSSRLRSQTTARWISALSVGPELHPRCPTGRGIPAPRSSLGAVALARGAALANPIRGCNNQCRTIAGRSRSCSRCPCSASSSSPR